MVDEDRARRHAGERAVRAQHHAAQVVVVADAGEHDLGACDGFTRRGGMAAAKFRCPGLRLGGRAVIDGDVVAGARQMAGHGQAHDAQAEECDF